MTVDRYIRQSTLAQIGEQGQQRIAAARVAIVGLGSLGSVAAELLVRAGVGFIRIIDRDYVNLNNLQRSALYTEQDAAQSLPKAIAAKQHLDAINSQITIEATITDVNSQTVEGLISDVDIILDATDNYAVRFLLNEACHALRKTWVYGGALGTIGSMMVIKPGGPCLRCLVPTVPAPGSYPTCASVGVLATTTQIIASLQVTAVLKLIVSEPTAQSEPTTQPTQPTQPVQPTQPEQSVPTTQPSQPMPPQPDQPTPTAIYISLDVWDMSLDEISVEQNPSCPCCVHEQYEYLGKPPTALTTELCGRDEFQVLPAAQQELDLVAIGARLRKQGGVTVSPFILTFDDGELRIKLFKDGRAMIQGAKTAAAAISLYSDYIGL